MDLHYSSSCCGLEPSQFHKYSNNCAKKEILLYVMDNWEQPIEHLIYDYCSQEWYGTFFRSTPAIYGALSLKIAPGAGQVKQLA